MVLQEIILAATVLGHSLAATNTREQPSDTWTAMVNCLNAESSILPSSLVTQQNNLTMYDQLNFQVNSYKLINPKAYLAVNKAEQVQAAVRCSVASRHPIVPRGGGHSYEKYSLIDSQHLVLDLEGLSEFSIDKDNKVATFGAGHLLGDVYAKLWENGKFGVPAGTCPTVGLSGHTLGGGYGLSSRKYGLMSDQVVEMEMVNAKGELIKVNQKENPDLFFALRGAGLGSYGVVTKFKLKVFDASQNITQLRLVYDYSQFDQVFGAWQQYSATNPDSNISSTLYVNPLFGIYFTSVIQHNERTDDLVKMLVDSFPRKTKEPVDRRSMSFIDMIIEQGEIATVKNTEQLSKVNRHSVAASYFKGKSNYVDKMLDIGTIESLKTAVGSGKGYGAILFSLQGGAMAQPDPHATAYNHRKNMLYGVQLLLSSTNSFFFNALGLPWIERTYELTSSFSTGASYQNYIDGSLKHPLQAYYGDNLNRLVAIKAKVDPDNIFNNPLSIPTSL